LATPASSPAPDGPDVPPAGFDPAELVPPDPLGDTAGLDETEVPPWLDAWVVPGVGDVLDGTKPSGKFGELEISDDVVEDELAVVVADELAVVDVTAVVEVTAVVLTGANWAGAGAAVVVTVADGVGSGAAVVVTVADGVGSGAAVVVTVADGVGSGAAVVVTMAGSSVTIGACCLVVAIAGSSVTAGGWVTTGACVVGATTTGGATGA
jgi:hypothetical protein